MSTAITKDAIRQTLIPNPNCHCLSYAAPTAPCRPSPSPASSWHPPISQPMAFTASRNLPAACMRIKHWQVYWRLRGIGRAARGSRVTASTALGGRPATCCTSTRSKLKIPRLKARVQRLAGSGGFASCFFLHESTFHCSLVNIFSCSNKLHARPCLGW